MPILPLPPNTASSSSVSGISSIYYRDATATREYLKQLENKPKEQLMDFLIYQNTEGESVGMTISRHQDAVTTQQYLQLLKDALENGKLTLEQFTMLLMQQNKEGGSVGMFIAFNQDATTTQAYLRMLENALKNGKLTSEQFTRILTQQDTDGRSIGMTIARHQNATTTQAYLRLLKNVLESGNLTSEQLTRILTQETDGWSVGKFIAFNQDETTTQAYLQLLKDALENGKLTSEQLTRILTQQNTDGWSVGMFIVPRQDATTTQTYLQLLKNVLENKNLTSEQLAILLTKQNEDGWSVGMLISCNRDAAITQTYFQLLENALKKENLTSEQLAILLTKQNTDGWSIGMIIAFNKDAATTRVYLQMLENALENGKLTSEQLTILLTQQNNNGWSVGMFIAHHQDKTTDQQCQNLKKIIPLIEKIEKTSSLLESLKLEEAIGELKNLLLFKNDIGITDSQKISLNKKIRNLISDFNSRISEQKTAEFFEFLTKVPDTSLFYISALISQLNLWTLDSTALNTVFLKLHMLPKTSFGYKEGQLALATYYVSLFSQTEKMFTASELLVFLIPAERCEHPMLGMGYNMLRNYFIEGNTAAVQGATSSLASQEAAPDIILKKVLKSLVLLVSNDLSAFRTLEGVLNQHRKDNLLDFYLEKTLFNDSSETENTSNFFKSSPLSLFPTNKSKKIHITSEQLQELESLIPSNQQHNDVKESIAVLINEFNKGSITKENLFEKLRNSINEGNPDYLFVERAMTSSAPSTSQ